jgi:hypothetical protein
VTTSFDWRTVRYRNVISVLKNPFYAGAYAYGKTENRTEIIDGRGGTKTVSSSVLHYYGGVNYGMGASGTITQRLAP